MMEELKKTNEIYNTKKVASKKYQQTLVSFAIDYFITNGKSRFLLYANTSTKVLKNVYNNL